MINALILAAGRSTRMGRLKQVLPLGEHTVIERVVTTFLATPVDEVVVVTGHEHQQVAAVLQRYPVRIVFNPDYLAGEMISSVQAGLQAMGPEVEAVLLAVGDQPQIRGDVIDAVLQRWQGGPADRIVIPSFDRRRGHPACLPRAVWPAVLALGRDESLRTLWRTHAALIDHLAVTTPSVLADLDTPEDYHRLTGEPAGAQ